jgi:hypothetical protein
MDLYGTTAVTDLRRDLWIVLHGIIATFVTDVREALRIVLRGIIAVTVTDVRGVVHPDPFRLFDLPSTKNTMTMADPLFALLAKILLFRIVHLQKSKK